MHTYICACAQNKAEALAINTKDLVERQKRAHSMPPPDNHYLACAHTGITYVVVVVCCCFSHSAH